MKNKTLHILITLIFLVLSQNLLSQTYLDSLKNSLNNKDINESEKVKLLNEIGYYYLESDTDYDNDSILRYSNLALDLSKKLKNSYNEALALKNIGFAFYYQQAFDTSLHIFNLSLQIVDEYEDIKLRKDLYNVIGACYYYKGECNKTLEFWKKDFYVR